jgi:hypothetical protein
MMSKLSDTVVDESSGVIAPLAAPDATAVQAILDLVQARGPEKSICPTDAARAMAGDAADADAWRRFLPRVRVAAVHLAQAGAIDILRKGKRISPDAMHGVVRLRLAVPVEET